MPKLVLDDGTEIPLKTPVEIWVFYEQDGKQGYINHLDFDAYLRLKELNALPEGVHSFTVWVQATDKWRKEFFPQA